MKNPVSERGLESDLSLATKSSNYSILASFKKKKTIFS